MRRLIWALLAVVVFVAAASVPAVAGTVYSSGPLNGNFSHWTINFGYSITDEFTLTSATTVGAVDFTIWAYPDASLSSVDWSISSTAFGGPFTTATTTGTYQFTNRYGWNVDNESFSTGNLVLGPGTYYLTLQNGIVSDDFPVAWDENDGSSIGYYRLPDGSENSISNYDCFEGVGCGLSGGETFSLEGAVPEPSSLLLMGSGLVSFAGIMRRKLKA